MLHLLSIATIEAVTLFAVFCWEYRGLLSGATQGNASALPPPRWVVCCRGCFKTFVHSYVSDARKLQDYLHPTEPVVPPEDVELVGPKCRTKAAYHSTDLQYLSR
jgi:hypothetical protein